MSKKVHESNSLHDVHLTIRNFYGSVEHYYHYLLGFFVPLISVCKKLNQDGNVRRVYVRSCGIFDDFTRLAEFSEIIILNKFEYQKMRDDQNIMTGNDIQLKFLEYDGFDKADVFSAEAFSRVALILNTQFCDEIEEAKAELNLNRSIKRPFIVFIDRGVPDAFYSSHECELKTSGSQRRSIANSQLLQYALSLHSPNAFCTTLENKSIFFQIALFSTADIIIAQHGAALANLIWCKANTTLIEILPNGMPGEEAGKSCFNKLATVMQVKYRKLKQKGPHAPVDIKQLIKYLPSRASADSTSTNNQQKKQASLQLRGFLSPGLYPVYGDEYTIVVDKNVFYVQDGNEDKILRITPSAAFIFNACLGNKSIVEIVDEISIQYPDEDKKSDILNDVETVITEFIERGIVYLVEQSPFPDFLIIGAMKSGTSTLDKNLSDHPEVFMAHDDDWAELQYFYGKNWECGDVWYRSHFTQQGRLQGEKTPLYLSSEEAMSDMYRLLPNAKIVVLLRDPVTRAYSHWNHFNQIPEKSKHWGWKQCDFEEGLEFEPDILTRGEYARQLEFLFQLYPRHQVYIGIAEKFRTNGLIEYNKVCNFLGINQVSTEYSNHHVREYDSEMSEEMKTFLTDYYKFENEALFDLL